MQLHASPKPRLIRALSLSIHPAVVLHLKLPPSDETFLRISSTSFLRILLCHPHRHPPITLEINSSPIEASPTPGAIRLPDQLLVGDSARCDLD